MALSINDGVHHVDNLFLSKAAATALIIASKFHECKNTLLLKMTSFDLFCKELVAFECEVLSKIKFSINPSITPSMFIEYLISLCQYEYDEITIQNLFITSANLLTVFWEDPLSLLFSPCTIAFSIIFTSFRILQINYLPWLQYVPECCSSSYVQSGSNGINTYFYNVEKCKEVVQRLLPELEIPTPVSPVAVTDGSFSPECVNSPTVNGVCKSVNGRQNNFVNNYKVNDDVEVVNNSPSFSFDISAIEADSDIDNSKVQGVSTNYMFHAISHM